MGLLWGLSELLNHIVRAQWVPAIINTNKWLWLLLLLVSIWKDIHKNKNDYLENGIRKGKEDKEVFRPIWNFQFLTRAMFQVLCNQQSTSANKQSNRYREPVKVLRYYGAQTKKKSVPSKGGDGVKTGFMENTNHPHPSHWYFLHIQFFLCPLCLKKQARRPTWSPLQIDEGPPEKLEKRLWDCFQSSQGPSGMAGPVASLVWLSLPNTQ